MTTIVLAGGSGFLGRKLAARFEREGAEVLTLTRRPRPGVRSDLLWKPGVTAAQWAERLEGAHAVFNLAGENLGEKRWTERRKRVLKESRIVATRSLVDAIHRCQTPPRVFVSSSAVGYYGARGDEAITETTPPGHDELAQLCVAWEREASAVAGDSRIRLVITRSGLIMSPDGGALKEMLLPFRFGLGATLGSGRQFWPWIHIDDWVELAAWVVATDTARGVFNLTAPNPVTNREFTKTLARVIHRPALLQAPGFALKLILGELAQFVLTGQRVLPAHAESLGFQFKFRELEPALRDLFDDHVRGHRDTKTQR
jgi:uncharacterized protein (TIGR01777 family)